MKKWCFFRLVGFSGFKKLERTFRRKIPAKNKERTFRKKVPAGFEKSGCEQAFDAAEDEGDERDGGKDQCGGEHESHAEDESQRDEEALDGRAGVEFLAEVGPPRAMDMWGAAVFFFAQGSVGNIHHLDFDLGRLFCLSGIHEIGRDGFRLRHVPA